MTNPLQQPEPHGGEGKGIEKPAFTPGPWRVGGWQGTIIGAKTYTGVHAAVWKGRDLICSTGLEGTPQSLENARLIAAAPDLLAACKGLLERLDEYYAASRITHPPCMKAARLALALASGEESK